MTNAPAGTGRFLEVISRTLGTSVEQLDSITENVTPHAITSMCTVFAESEVISLRSAGRRARSDSRRSD
ncbi:ATPase, activator of (R)-hydroxyglutaryl-CoA dehydratase [Escherichia coli]|uniref:ATPase, activator of (R)-hydroxyglutaryl-CoA dehydratase n=1 Tax=Escherichia coli TaxID=562 RepID=A0A376RPV6_ECOLX|nr:ATPase, activator of (R)-hydroxyglutaryl-CoA dehydratase [Escherichia coli]